MKLITALIASLVVISGVASAQSWTANEAAGIQTHTANITSATTLVGVPVTDARNKMFVFLKAAALESATLIYQDAAGNALDSTAVAVGTTYSGTTLTGPQYFSSVKISPTTLTGTDNIDAKVIQTMGSGYR